MANGYDPNLTLIMRHAGSDTDSLRAKLGTAASLTLEETDYGPKLRRWKPFSTLAVAPRNAPANRGATYLLAARHWELENQGLLKPGPMRDLARPATPGRHIARLWAAPHIGTRDCNCC